MKKINLILLIFVFLFSFSAETPTSADNEKVFYAKITSSNTFLCSTPSENSQIFELPYSYFVKIDYVVDDYFKVNYDGVEGYVKKDKVSLMNGTPSAPYANASFKLFVPYAIYQSPNTNSTKLADVDTTATLKYFGTKSGQQLNSTSNKWYYCQYQNNDQQINGYIFSGVTDYLTSISTNNETFEIISEDTLSATESSEFQALSTGTKIILIIAISLPSVLILYFLIKPSRILQNQKKRKSKTQTKTIRHGDYFEFDESEL